MELEGVARRVRENNKTWLRQGRTKQRRDPTKGPTPRGTRTRTYRRSSVMVVMNLATMSTISHRGRNVTRKGKRK